MKHVAMVIPTVDKIGGAERQVLLLAKGLAARGWRVTVIALSGTGAMVAEELATTGAAYLSLGMRKAWIDPRGWRHYFAWAALNKPEIVHAHLPHATWFARWVRLLSPVRVVVDTIHTSHTSGWGRRLGYRLSNWLGDHVTCVSAAVADAHAAKRIVSRKNLSVVPNGVLLPGPAQRHKFQYEGSRFRWISVGRLAAVKDYPTLLHAFASLQGHPWLQIVGSGPEEQALRSLAGKLKIDDRVLFTGFQQDVLPMLAAADGFVLSSLWEGLPVSVLEAQAAGLPVVATDTPGSREAMQPGVTGLIAPVGDGAGLAHTMAEIMAMPRDHRQQMGDRGRQSVEEKYALPAILTQWEALYERLLAEHPCIARWR